MGFYRERQQLQKRLNEIEESKPRIQVKAVVDTRKFNQHPPFEYSTVKVRVWNEPITLNESSVAHRVVAYIQYHDLGGNTLTTGSDWSRDPVTLDVNGLYSEITLLEKTVIYKNDDLDVKSIAIKPMADGAADEIRSVEHYLMAVQLRGINLDHYFLVAARDPGGTEPLLVEEQD